MVRKIDEGGVWVFSTAVDINFVVNGEDYSLVVPDMKTASIVSNTFALTPLVTKCEVKEQEFGIKVEKFSWEK